MFKLFSGRTFCGSIAIEHFRIQKILEIIILTRKFQEKLSLNMALKRAEAGRNKYSDAPQTVEYYYVENENFTLMRIKRGHFQMNRS